MQATTNSRATLKGHPEANHGDSRLQLNAIPQMPQEKIIPVVQEACLSTKPDLVLLQMDPMNWLVRQRFMSHKHALHEIEDYDERAIEDMQFP